MAKSLCIILLNTNLPNWLFSYPNPLYNFLALTNCFPFSSVILINSIVFINKKALRWFKATTPIPMQGFKFLSDNSKVVGGYHFLYHKYMIYLVKLIIHYNFFFRNFSISSKNSPFHTVSL